MYGTMSVPARARIYSFASEILEYSRVVMSSLQGSHKSFRPFANILMVFIRADLCPT